MERTVVCKLNTTPAVDMAFRKTMSSFAEASMIALRGGTEANTSNKVRIQHLCYKEIREKCGLSANLTVRAIARAAWAMKAAKTKNRVVKAFKPTSIDYDQRIFDFREREEQVSLTTVEGRVRVPMILGDYQRKALRGKKPTAAKLVLRNREWYIHIVVSEEPGEKIESISAIGIDRGIYNIAVTSEGKFHSGRKAMHARERFAARRAKLQSIGTASSRRVLKRLSGKERRWMRNENHRISKAIVEEAVWKKAVIKLEDLKDIRTRLKRFSRVWNRKINAWAFAELEAMIRYKAERVGVEVISVPAKDTSRTCPRCGVVDKASRSGAHFKCAACGYRLAADLAAAKTISKGHARLERALVMEPMVSSPHRAPKRQAAGL